MLYETICLVSTQNPIIILCRWSEMMPVLLIHLLKQGNIGENVGLWQLRKNEPEKEKN